MMYRTHCQRMLDTVVSANFEGVSLILPEATRIKHQKALTKSLWQLFLNPKTFNVLMVVLRVEYCSYSLLVKNIKSSIQLYHNSACGTITVVTANYRWVF